MRGDVLLSRWLSVHQSFLVIRDNRPAMRIAFPLFCFCALILSVDAQSSSDAEASPTGRGSCIRQGNSWVCELDGQATPTSSAITSAAPTSEATSAAVATTSTSGLPPMPTDQGVCELHDDHWHCEGLAESSESHEGHDHAGHSHASGSHAGHSHGPSEEFGCGLAPLEDYDLPIHIGAVFILLAAALAGSLLPHLARVIDRKRRSPTSASLGKTAAPIFFAFRYFGGGIILSTAFIHLLFHALIAFTNECIGTMIYEPVSPAIAMAAVYVVFLIDFFVLKPLRRRALEDKERPIDSGTEEGKVSTPDSESVHGARRSSSVGSSTMVSPEAKLQRWNLVALEAGIVFHSIIIGVTLGTSSGAGWVPLLIAITFHQFCEGLGLSSRIALLSSQVGKVFKLSMHIAFVVSTSVGIAIGIGVRQSFNGNDRSTLLATGILDSISAGILLYSGFVQILVNDFLYNKDIIRGSNKRSLAAVGWLTAGMFVMSILGYWA